MLSILDPILKGRGYRVLLASGATRAARLLDLELGIDSVMIRAGLAGSEQIELTCLRRGVEVLFLCGIVEAGVIRLRVPDKRLDYAPRILIVDDEPAVRALFDCHLAEDGYRVTAVETGRQALAAVQKTTFDVIVVDLSLPDIDGIEAIRNFHAASWACRPKRSQNSAGADRAPARRAADARPWSIQPSPRRLPTGERRPRTKQAARRSPACRPKRSQNLRRLGSSACGPQDRAGPRAAHNPNTYNTRSAATAID